MNMIEKIQEMMSEKKLTKADVAKGAEIPYTTLDGLFKKKFENTRFPTLRKIALFFDVSMEYLVVDEESDKDYGKVIVNELTREEHNLIASWRKLSHENQLKLTGVIEFMFREESATKEEYEDKIKRA